MSYVPELGPTREQLRERKLQKATPGISAETYINTEITRLQTGVDLMVRIDTHRQALNHLLEQRAIFGASTAPHILHSINKARGEIQQIKAALNENRSPISDHPFDADEPQAPASTNTSVTNRVLNPNIILGGLYAIEDELANGTVEAATRALRRMRRYVEGRLR